MAAVAWSSEAVLFHLRCISVALAARDRRAFTDRQAELIDPAAFGRAVIVELNALLDADPTLVREDGGATFERAVTRAIEAGAEGVRLPEEG